MNIPLNDSLARLTGKAQLEALWNQAPRDKIALLSAFNPEDVILSAWLNELGIDVPVFFLDTQKHFPDTLRYVEEIRARTNIKDLRVLTPDPTLVKNIDAEGELWKHQVNRCCWLRKVEPLERAIAAGGFTYLITGRRQEQASTRGNLGSTELDENNRLKLNPLIHMTKLEREAEMERLHLPHHPLYTLGYLSIGCAPCTTPVFAGEDERAGRWRHTRLNDEKGKVECGLHSEGRGMRDEG